MHLDPSRFGYCDIALAVAREWRGRGVGTALFETAHRLRPASAAATSSASPSSPTTPPRSRLYRKLGFVEEGRRVKQFRRQSGELWDSVEMGLLL